jgi:very-short-patch-repair endonuclease
LFRNAPVLDPLHRIHRGVYAVGHTRLTVRARWMAAVLACGTDAALSHQDAAALHGLVKIGSGDIHVTATMARNHGRRGVKALREALADLTEEPGWTQSELERRFVALTRAHGLPLPLTNQYVEGELVDAYWPDHRLIVEVDGWRTHKPRAAFETDRVRDAKLVAAGYRVLRITYRRLRDDPRGVADDLRRALDV